MSTRAVAWAREVRAVGAPTDRALLVRLAEAVAPRQRLAHSYLGRLERRGFVALRSGPGDDDVVVFALPIGGAS